MISRRRFQVRLLYLLAGITGFSVYLTCILGHFGLGVQLGALLTTLAAAGGLLFCAQLYLLRLFYIVLPQKIVLGLRRLTQRKAPLDTSGRSGGESQT